MNCKTHPQYAGAVDILLLMRSKCKVSYVIESSRKLTIAMELEVNV